MHKRPYSLLVGVILFASIGCQGKISHVDHGQTLRETREAAAQAIERAYDNWYRGWETKDHELAARDYSDDAIWVNAFGMKRVGRAAAKAKTQAVPRQGWSGLFPPGKTACYHARY